MVERIGRKTRAWPFFTIVFLECTARGPFAALHYISAGASRASSSPSERNHGDPGFEAASYECSSWPLVRQHRGERLKQLLISRSRGTASFGATSRVAGESHCSR